LYHIAASPPGSDKKWFGLDGVTLYIALIDSFIFELFKKANLTFETKSAMCDALEQITSYVTGSKHISTLS
jgi:hypothetical protein